ncbi:MAG: futalosine synthase [Nitrospirae bacterium]|nr:MAG: futalosine synthase [Nitrospirota bacterium]
MSKPLRIGLIPYLNLYPLYFFLRVMPYQFIEGVPTEVNRLIREGMIDISPSSSVEFLRHGSLYRLIEGHSISSIGEVKSIVLFSHYRIEQLGGKNILSTYQSGTSVLLLEVILRRFYGLDYTLKISDKPLREGMKEADAYLLIGDDALKGSIEADSFYRYDLGKLWHEKTGLPFVYALWIARKDVDEEALKGFIYDLDRARDFSVQNFPIVALSLRGESFMSEEEIVSYWRGLSYELTDEHRRGLELFKGYLEELGLL